MKRILSALALAGVLALSGQAGAAGSTAAEVTADPASIEVGGSSTITATGLGGLETAGFGLDNTAAGTFAVSGGASGSSVEAPVQNGSATVTFTASQAGTFTIAVGDGETVLGQTTITVTQGAPTPSEEVRVQASPESLEVGGTTTITATGLGGLETAGFGLDDNAAGTFSVSGGASGSSVEAPVSNGSASVTFTAAEAGTFTIAVGDGETVLGQTTVTVAAASPTPTSSPTRTSTPTPEPAPAGGLSTAVVIWIIVAVLVVAAAVTTAVILIRRRRNGGTVGGDATPGE